MPEYSRLGYFAGSCRSRPRNANVPPSPLLCTRSTSPTYLTVMTSVRAQKKRLHAPRTFAGLRSSG